MLANRKAEGGFYNSILQIRPIVNHNLWAIEADFIFPIGLICGPDSVVCIATATGWTVRGSNRVEAIFSAPVQIGRGAHPASCTMGTGSFSAVKSYRGRTLTPHLPLVPWSRKGIAIPLLSLWAVRPIQILSACSRVRITFTLLVSCEYSGLKTVDVRHRHRHACLNLPAFWCYFAQLWTVIFVISLPDLFRTDLRWIDFWIYPSLRLWFKKETGLSGSVFIAFFR